MRAFLIVSLFLMATVTSHAAETSLRVSVSILPLQALVRAVMHDPARPEAGPELILPPGASPHAYALKPSGARTLSSAQVIFRVGPGLEAFLDRPMANLAPDARRIDLIDAPGLILLPLREDADFAHGDHDDHATDGDAAHEHEHGHVREHSGDHADHDEQVDPHIWLHPANAIAMVHEIARVLGDADPANTALYQANAVRTAANIDATMTRFAAGWQTLRGLPETVPFVVFHDSLQYFEHWAGIASSGSITLNPEVPAGARHMQELRQRMAADNVRCVFVEPQLDGRIARQIAGDAGLSVHVADPIGRLGETGAVDDGAGGYINLIGGIRQALSACYQQHLNRSPFADGTLPVKD